MSTTKETMPAAVGSGARITRRTLVGGGVVAHGASALVAGSAMAQSATPHAMDHGTPAATPEPPLPPTPFNGVTGEPLREPSVRASENGVLETTFTAALGSAIVAGQEVTAMVYEGAFPGPTLRLRAGDTLRLKLVNQLDDTTNIHTHGFHVSPKDNGDNIFIEVPAGTEFDYEYQLPDNHPPGTYWYHPHAHGNTAVQVNGGMAGVIVVEGSLDEVEGVAGLTEHTLVLSATQFDGDGTIVPFTNQSATSVQRFVNGQLEPTIAIHPGETQRWRIANVSSDTFFLIALQGHTLYEIANDGNPYDHVVARETSFSPRPSEPTC
jgi:FtsP/CotA-like multicopper oxidase with cupredoxin domain